jgi:hypothetical protein
MGRREAKERPHAGSTTTDLQAHDDLQGKDQKACQVFVDIGRRQFLRGGRERKRSCWPIGRGDAPCRFIVAGSGLLAAVARRTHPASARVLR